MKIKGTAVVTTEEDVPDEYSFDETPRGKLVDLLEMQRPGVEARSRTDLYEEEGDIAKMAAARLQQLYVQADMIIAFVKENPL